MNPVYYTAESTNKRSFEIFIKKIADALGLNPVSPQATHLVENDSVLSSNSYISDD